jgi:hypothetical protein
MGHHYAIWASDSNIWLAQKKNFGPANGSFQALLVLLSVGMSMLFGIAIKACVILYNMINLVLRRRSAKVGQPRVSIIEVTLLVLW